ncbi:MAG: M48 family metallopeptidase [Chitinophagales bacterium]
MKLEDLDIKIHKANRKTVSVFVERDGTVSARVPENISDADLKEVLKAKEYQIFKNLAEWTQLNEKYVLREFVSGQSFLYLGRNYRLKVVEENNNKLIFTKGVFYLGKQDVYKGKEHFIAFYKEKLKEKIKTLVHLYEQNLGVKAKDVKIMELQNRWASCTKSGNINFHWKCAMAPIDVLNYIVLHELAHLIQLNHTKEFWNEIDKIMPNYDKHLHWLKINGAGMDL